MLAVLKIMPNMSKKRIDPMISAAAKKCGGLTQLSIALGLTGSAAYQWKRIPVSRVAAIEKLTGIPREVLRPDIFRKAA